MTPERWQHIQDVFNQVVERPAEERSEFLRKACGEDGELRREVLSLLKADSGDDEFIESPAAGERFSLLTPESLISGAHDPAVGRRVGPYRLVRIIASGGMGAVYLAERDDGQFEQQVAVKFIRYHPNQKALMERFYRERQLLAKLAHPHIARLIDGGTNEHELPYLVMEYVEGLTVDRYCDQHKLSIDRRLELFREICSAINYAHQNLIVHCDLKPNNILVTADGVPKLLDFGIARILSADGESRVENPTTIPLTLMTPDYASPEQIRGEPVTTATDVYSLGVALYELLTGHKPFAVRTRLRHEIERQICEQEPVRPSQTVTLSGGGASDKTAETLPYVTREGSPHKLRSRLTGDVDTIILTALRKEPARRYASVAQLSEDVRLHLAGLPIVARKDTFGYRANKFVRRHRAGVVAAALVVLSLLSGILGTTWMARTASAERDEARKLRTLAETNLSRAQEAEAQCALEADTATQYAETAQNSVERAEAINTFLQTMLASVDPVNDGRGATVLQVLNKADMRVKTELVDQPLVEAAVRRTIGRSYHALGSYGQAEEHLRAALELHRSHEFGAVDAGPEYPLCIRDLADLLREKGEFEQAEKLYREALSRFRAMLGPEHADSAGTLADLATLLHEMGDSAEATPLCREALKLYMGLLADDEAHRPNLQTAERLNQLGFILQSTGDWTAAEPLFEQSLAIRRKLLRSDHPHLAESMHNLAEVLAAQGEYERAAPLLVNALRIRRRALPRSHPNTASTLMLLGHVLLARGGHLGAERAEEMLRECLEIRSEALGEDHWLTAEAESVLGEALTALGRFDEAEALVLNCYPKLKSDCGEDHERTLDALERIIRLYDAWGKPEQGEPFRRLYGYPPSGLAAPE